MALAVLSVCLLVTLCSLECQGTSSRDEMEHQWHQEIDPAGHDVDVVDDVGLHDIADNYQDFFQQDEKGQSDFNMTAIMFQAGRQMGGGRGPNGPRTRPSFVREPVIPNSILKRLSPDIIVNMTAAEVFQLQQVTEMSYESMAHLLSNLKSDEFDRLFEVARNSSADFENDIPNPTITQSVLAACSTQWGPVSGWTMAQVLKLGPLVTGMNVEQIKQLSEEVIPVIVETFARLRIGHPSAKTLVRQAKRSWGGISTWPNDRFHLLGPLLAYLTPRDLKQILPQNLTGLLPIFGSVDFQRGQARAIISIVSDQPEWEWTQEQVESLGKLRRFLDASELRAAPASAFASPELLREMLPSDGRGHHKQTREIARALRESKGAVGSWGTDDFRSMGRAASGLEVEDLEMLNATVVQEAIADIADAEFSPRQRRILVKKYEKARGNLRSVSAEEVRKMKGLAVGLSTSIIADMDPGDIRQSVEVFAKNAKKMKRTQKREIINQLRNAPGGIEDAIQDMGDMVKELPLKELDSLCTANFTAAADQNSTEMAAAGRMNWTKGQSMKLFRCFKREVLSSGEEGESSAEPLTPSTIRYMGSMAKGMSCEDIQGLVADDIIPTVKAMMEQEGWSARQLACSHQKVKDSLSHRHSDYTADFTETEIASLTGQLLKRFSMEELNTIPTEHCEMLYSEVGSRDLMALKRDKRKALTSNALQCLGVDSAEDSIGQDTMDVIGNLACDLDADALRRLSAAAFTGNLYNIQKCCLDMDQLVVIRERLGQDMDSPNQWSSDTISDIGPLLVSLSDQEIQSLDGDEFSLVAEDVLQRFAEYKEKWQAHCDVDLRPEDKERREEGFVAVAMEAKEALVTSAEEEGGSRRKRRRRRRQITAPNCEVIESLGDGNIAWTVEELAAMTADTFDSCGYALGEVAGFPESKISALVQKALEAWGEAEYMTPDQISQLGHIASGLTAEDLGQLNLTDTDTIYAVARFDIYTSEQLSAGVGRFLELSGAEPASLDALDVTALSNFLCGLTASQLGNIANDIYQEAANVIGELKSCDASQWAALKVKAVAGYGDIASWMPEVFTEVGSVVAGFTVEELGSLSNTSIAGIKPHAVSLIPPQTFSDGWSSTQLSQLDQLQAEAVTEDQLEALSQDQRSALLQAEYGGDVDLADEGEQTQLPGEEGDEGENGKKGNGAGYPSAGFLPIVIAGCVMAHRIL